MVEKCLSLPLFLSFLSSLYFQSVPCYTESVGLVMMRGIIYTNQSPPLIFFPSLQHGAQLSSLPKMHLSKISTCCCAVKTHYGYFSMPCFTWKSYRHSSARFYPLTKSQRMAPTDKKQLHSTFCHVWTWFCFSASQRYLRQAGTGSTNVTHLKFPSLGISVFPLLGDAQKWNGEKAEKYKWLKWNRRTRKFSWGISHKCSI